MTADPDLLFLAFAGLFSGHHAGDYWLQSDWQATTKGSCSREGRRACTHHVASLTTAQAVLVALLMAATGSALDPVALAAGLAINSASHWWADRRHTLRGLVLATEWATKKAGFYENVPGAPAHMDQAWHMVWLLPAAAAIAAPAPLALAIAAASAGLLAAAEIASRRARTNEPAPS